MIFIILKEILKGKSLLRTLMNLELRNYKLEGKVLDIGGGKNPSYFNFLQKSGKVEVINAELEKGEGRVALDLEKDDLPFTDSSIDQVLMFNILEHIYNYNFLAREVCRVLKPGGQVLGFTPFFINVHPDPHDYFRYTGEALEKIFKQAGFRKIKIKEIGRGPAAVNFNNIILIIPKFLRAIIFPFCYLVDWVIMKIRPEITKRYPLGYFFVLRK